MGASRSLFLLRLALFTLDSTDGRTHCQRPPASPRDTLNAALFAASTAHWSLRALVLPLHEADREVRTDNLHASSVAVASVFPIVFAPDCGQLRL